jgi:hypothetical protein
LHLVGYIGIQLGAHPVLHISRIRVKVGLFRFSGINSNSFIKSLK